ncbi:hypothetical protein BDV25DRAFT_137198 [Aspergillus avenaceus]|uniref:Uncharacterized protein n=1 Tax=Aspergillus avenaceus TaxID=36643 RepID=A0A5N6U3B1_ASPAV|nr:hypothetical protein BDV25DRAFT_137198 [Aspergillus avenaceus]
MPTVHFRGAPVILQSDIVQDITIGSQHVQLGGPPQNVTADVESVDAVPYPGPGLAAEEDVDFNPGELVAAFGGGGYVAFVQGDTQAIFHD